MAVVRLNLARLHLCHQSGEGLCCSTLPSLEGSRHLAGLSGNGVAADVGPQLPVSGRSLPHRAGLDSPDFSRLEVLTIEHPSQNMRIAGRVSYHHACRDLLWVSAEPGGVCAPPGL